MPIYEYKCASCGSVFEALILRSTEVPSCPECESSEVARLMSAPASCHTESSSSTPCGRECCVDGGGASRSCGCSGACRCH